jgi:hypothetical protein
MADKWRVSQLDQPTQKNNNLIIDLLCDFSHNTAPKAAVARVVRCDENSISRKLNKDSMLIKDLSR